MVRARFGWAMLSVLLASVCWGAETRGSAAAPRGVAQRRAVLNDRDIERAIQERLARSEKVSKNGFKVQVQGGVARLTGRTDVIQHKAAATRMAKAAGARDVRNEIEISAAARERATRILAAGRRRVAVTRSDVPGRH